MAESAKWYVIHTYSGYENKVAQNVEKVVENRGLQEWIREVKVPTEKIMELKDDQPREVVRKVFPGYVFIKMILSDESWYVVRNIRGVTGFVGTSTKPTPLSEAEVQKLSVETVQHEVKYQVGDAVTIIAGQLVGFSGVVQSIDLEHNVVTLTISMMGRESSVELALHDVRKD